jgi:hypothetical protein
VVLSWVAWSWLESSEVACRELFAIYFVAELAKDLSLRQLSNSRVLEPCY